MLKKIAAITLMLMLVGCAATSDGGGGTTLTGELSSRTIVIGDAQYKWETTERGIITEFKYESESRLQAEENELAKVEVRDPNIVVAKNGRFIVTIYGSAISSVSNGNAKAFLVQNGKKIITRSVSGVANMPDSNGQWWNLVLIPLDSIDINEEFELRVMYSFDSKYSNFTFTPL
ncbi:hypothetical protein AB4371_19645 [Vibrio sp. 10N.261.51.A3]|uniref:hypothetical protein n=1 Tax=Vibrio sp. 10N.261.51.A3 TaxID=3229673 RepID=UPI003552A28E